VFIGLHKTIVRPQLEYTSQVRFHRHVSFLDRIEKVQKRGTKVVICGKTMSFEQCLSIIAKFNVI